MRYFVEQHNGFGPGRRPQTWYSIRECAPRDGMGLTSLTPKIATSHDAEVAHRICNMMNGINSVGRESTESNGYVTMPKEMYATLVKERDFAEAQRDRGAATCTRVLGERDEFKRKYDEMVLTAARARAAAYDYNGAAPSAIIRRQREMIDKLIHERDEAKDKGDAARTAYKTIHDTHMGTLDRLSEANKIAEERDQLRRFFDEAGEKLIAIRKILKS